MSGSAFVISGITAFIVGWLAYRGSGHWWTGLAAGGTTWGLVVVGPIFVLAIFSSSVLGVPYVGTMDATVTPAIKVANFMVLGWLAYVARRAT